MKFSFRLTLSFGGLLIIALMIVLFSIDNVAKSSVLSTIETDLLRTVKTIDKLYKKRVQNLQHNMQLLASDYGFKSAYASNDEGTIHSALLNHQSRLKDSDFLILCDLDGIVLSNTYDQSLNNKPLVWQNILEMANESELGKVTLFGFLDGRTYQLVVTPLMAPDIDAWIIGGFKVDNKTAQEFSEITGSEITFFKKKKDNIRLIASTIDKTALNSLMLYLESYNETNNTMRYSDSVEINIGKIFLLSKEEQTKISIFVSQSLDKSLQPYKQLSTTVLMIFMASVLGTLLLMFLLSKKVSSSLVKLSSAAKAVSKGDFTTQLDVTSNDEFGLLSKTFNGMTKDLEEKEKVRNLLGKVVSPQIAHKLLQEGVELGGEEREITVLFCDIQGFTKLSELKSPTEVLDALNTFFSGVSNIIESHGGVVDKYMGDAVMAIFGAPLQDEAHAMNAVRCGIELSKAVDVLVSKLKLDDGYCSFGVGIHTGWVVAGNIGSENRLNYTVIGDTVNVAARVEGKTRFFDVILIVTRATVAQCPKIDFKSLGVVKLKGRTEEIEIFSI